jgi:hypothetical protein
MVLPAHNYDKDTRYLDLMLWLDQQRLFALSESSGLLNVDNRDNTRMLSSNALELRRKVIL